MNRISAQIEAEYAKARHGAAQWPQLAYQTSQAAMALAEQTCYMTIWFSGLQHQERIFQAQVGHFVRFCEACITAKSNEDLLELSRHPDAGNETQGT